MGIMPWNQFREEVTGITGEVIDEDKKIRRDRLEPFMPYLKHKKRCPKQAGCTCGLNQVITEYMRGG